MQIVNSHIRPPDPALVRRPIVTLHLPIDLQLSTRIIEAVTAAHPDAVWEGHGDTAQLLIDQEVDADG